MLKPFWLEGLRETDPCLGLWPALASPCSRLSALGGRGRELLSPRWHLLSSVRACVCQKGSGSNPVDLYCWFQLMKCLKIRSHLILNENFRLIYIQ